MTAEPKESLDHLLAQLDPDRQLDPESGEFPANYVANKARADSGLAAVLGDSDGTVNVVWVGPDNALMHAQGLGGDWSEERDGDKLLKTKAITTSGARLKAV